MARSTEEERLACPGKVKGGAGLAVGRQGCGSQLVAAIPRRVLLHVPRFIGNNGCARSTCEADSEIAADLWTLTPPNPCFDMCVIYDCRLSLKLQGDRVLPLSELCHLCVWLMIMQLLKESTTPWNPQFPRPTTGRLHCNF